MLAAIQAWLKLNRLKPRWKKAWQMKQAQPKRPKMMGLMQILLADPPRGLAQEDAAHVIGLAVRQP